VADDIVAFVGDVPRLYDQHLGPLLFEPNARVLAALIPWAQTYDLLELAAGTGRLTRHLAAAAGPDTRIVATDLQPPMIDRGRALLADHPRVEWDVADAADLPFADESFDVVVCQFGLMFLPDKAVGLAEWHRVLRPSGRVLAMVWDSLAANAAAAIVQGELESIFPQDPPRMLHTPYSMHDRDELRALATGAGFTDVAVREVAIESESPSAADTATGFLFGTPTSGALAQRAPDRLDEIHARVTAALAAELGERPLRFTIRALVLEGTKPR
jgi:SAM-dependent methyltransferase